MAYDDLKVHDGRKYMGMPVGGRHSWDYPDGRWEEEKLGPDRWSFTFSSPPTRHRGSAPSSVW